MNMPWPQESATKSPEAAIWAPINAFNINRNSTCRTQAQELQLGPK